MNFPKPRFELARVYADGTKEVEIVPVTDIPLDTTTGRRGFLATALTAAAVLGSTCQAYTTNSIKNVKARSLSAEEKYDCGNLVSHRQLISALAFTSDGHTLASGSSDKTIKLWNLPAGTLRQTLEGHTGGVYVIAISSDGRTLASTGSREAIIKLWELPSGIFKGCLIDLELIRKQYDTLRTHLDSSA